MARLMQRQGFAATGLQQILRESGAPKGSLYHHFPGGKEQLAAEAVALSGQRVAGAIRATLQHIDDPGDVARAIAGALGRQLSDSGFVDGCPIATVALEVPSNSGAMIAAVSEAFASWEALLAERLVEHGRPPADAARLASFAMSAIEGALLLSRAHRDIEPLRIAADQLADLLRDSR
jgi:TetR/AcrR family transcriptional repressor of lmrAB and yxaGH operons